MTFPQSLLKDPSIAALFADLARMNNDREAEAAKRDPLSNKLCRVFDPGVSANYRYWGPVKNGKGQKVRFCWASHRNAAGFFLGWRETWMKNGNVKRDRWYSRKVKARAADVAKSRYDKAQEEARSRPDPKLREAIASLAERP